jgi:hypothetical protein
MPKQEVTPENFNEFIGDIRSLATDIETLVAKITAVNAKWREPTGGELLDDPRLTAQQKMDFIETSRRILKQRALIKS